jgi:hypothetical protein
MLLTEVDAALLNPAFGRAPEGAFNRVKFLDTGYLNEIIFFYPASSIA